MFVYGCLWDPRSRTGYATSATVSMTLRLHAVAHPLPAPDLPVADEVAELLRHPSRFRTDSVVSRSAAASTLPVTTLDLSIFFRTLADFHRRLLQSAGRPMTTYHACYCRSYACRRRTAAPEALSMRWFGAWDATVQQWAVHGGDAGLLTHVKPFTCGQC